jgi:hypothetical protein
MSAFGGNVLQNYFEWVARAILIQDQTKMSNVDSPHRSIGFDYCAIAMWQRVLQHIRGQSGHRDLKPQCLTQSGIVGEATTEALGSDQKVKL